MIDKDYRDVQTYDMDEGSPEQRGVNTDKWDNSDVYKWSGGDYVAVEDYLDAVVEIDRLRRLIFHLKEALLLTEGGE